MASYGLEACLCSCGVARLVLAKSLPAATRNLMDVGCQKHRSGPQLATSTSTAGSLLDTHMGVGKLAMASECGWVTEVCNGPSRAPICANAPQHPGDGNDRLRGGCNEDNAGQ